MGHKFKGPRENIGKLWKSLLYHYPNIPFPFSDRGSLFLTLPGVKFHEALSIIL